MPRLFLISLSLLLLVPIESIAQDPNPPANGGGAVTRSATNELGAIEF